MIFRKALSLLVVRVHRRVPCYFVHGYVLPHLSTFETYSKKMFEYFRKEYISQFRREPISAVFTLLYVFVLQR